MFEKKLSRVTLPKGLQGRLELTKSVMQRSDLSLQGIIDEINARGEAAETPVYITINVERDRYKIKWYVDIFGGF